MKGQDESLVRALLELAPDAIVGVDRTGTIVLVNAQVEALFGYRRDELLGQPVEILVPDHAAHRHPGRRQAYFAAPRPRPMGAGAQLSARRRDGSEFPADISLGSIETPDGLLVSAAIRDVTDRIEAEKERERLKVQAERDRSERRQLQSQRLESLGQLAGGVAHDFNNLLAVIGNYAAFVRETIDAAATAPGATLDGVAGWTAAQRDIRQIERATEAASALTRQLLAFARREVVRPRSLDLNAVVAEVEALLSRTIGEDVELVVHPSPGLPAIEADPGQLQQLLMNLAINARHAMPRGGLLSITTAPTGGGVQLIVTDTGHGMDPETLNRAFEPFFTTKPRGEGSGLGLATVYGIVTQAGGDVLLESTVGIGTTLTATFPVAVDQTVPSAHSDARHTSGGPETVLVLDDEDGIRDVAERILRRHGYHVIVASTGEEAVEQAEHHAGPIDVLLTDVVMPRTSGPAVAEAVRVRRPGVRVLFMSGYARPELASHGRLGEGVELLEKPFTEAALLAKLRLVLDDRSAHR